MKCKLLRVLYSWGFAILNTHYLFSSAQISFLPCLHFEHSGSAVTSISRFVCQGSNKCLCHTHPPTPTQTVDFLLRGTSMHNDIQLGGSLKQCPCVILQLGIWIWLMRCYQSRDKKKLKSYIRNCSCQKQWIL